MGTCTSFRRDGAAQSPRTLFPHLGINDGNNLVQRGVKYGVPATAWFAFDQTPGEEDVMIILSRTPLESLPVRPFVKPDTQVLPAVLTELDRRVQSRDLVLFAEQKQTDLASIVVNTNAERNETVYAEMVLKNIGRWAGVFSAGGALDCSPARERWVFGARNLSAGGATESTSSAAPAGLTAYSRETQRSRAGLQSDAPPALLGNNPPTSEVGMGPSSTVCGNCLGNE